MPTIVDILSFFCMNNTTEYKIIRSNKKISVFLCVPGLEILGRVGTNIYFFKSFFIQEKNIIYFALQNA